MSGHFLDGHRIEATEGCPRRMYAKRPPLTPNHCRHYIDPSSGHCALPPGRRGHPGLGGMRRDGNCALRCVGRDLGTMEVFSLAVVMTIYGRKQQLADVVCIQYSVFLFSPTNLTSLSFVECSSSSSDWNVQDQAVRETSLE